MDLSVYPAAFLNDRNIMFNGVQCLPDLTEFLTPPVVLSVSPSGFLIPLGGRVPCMSSVKNPTGEELQIWAEVDAVRYVFRLWGVTDSGVWHKHAPSDISGVDPLGGFSP